MSRHTLKVWALWLLIQSVVTALLLGWTESAFCIVPPPPFMLPEVWAKLPNNEGLR